MAKESDLLLAKNSLIMKPRITPKMLAQQVMLDGLMAFGVMKNGLHVADFQCCEDVEMEPWTGQCKVQAMRDGNVYITEKPKRVRNKALFREDNSTFSLGRDDKYYFVFTMEKRQVKQLPDALVHQALSIAQKVSRVVLKKKEVRK